MRRIPCKNRVVFPRKRRDRSLEKWLLQLLGLIVCGAIFGYVIFKFVSWETSK